MPQFKESLEPEEADATRATARLPGLNIEIVHRRAPGGEAEQISITMQAVPSFEAFGRYLEASNPFAFWAEAGRAWFAWLEAVGAAMVPSSVAPLLPRPGADASQEAERPR